MSVKEQVIEALSQVGLTIPSSSNAQVTYKCEKCHDNGWIESSDGDYTFVKKCSCVLAREAEQRIKASGLAGVVQRQTFESFATSTQTQKQIKQTAKKQNSATFIPKSSLSILPECL